MLVGDRLIPPDTRVGLLIAFLCLTADYRASREAIGDALWPEQSAVDQLNSLRQTLFLAKKVMPILSDRAFVWIEPVVTDLDSGDPWIPLLVNWSHPWIEQARERDRVCFTEKILRKATQSVDPFQKIEFLKHGLSAHPLDEDICLELAELYQSLGWRTECRILLRSFEQLISKADSIIESEDLKQLLHPSEEKVFENQRGLSKQQKVEFVLATFPVQFYSGEIESALDSLQLILDEHHSTERKSMIDYYRVRCLIQVGRSTEALEISRERELRIENAYDFLLVGYSLFLNKEYVESATFLLNHSMLGECSDEVFCDAMIMAATTLIMGFEPDLALEVIEIGIKRASEISYRHGLLQLRSLKLARLRIIGSESSHISEYDRVIQYARKYGFPVQEFSLLASKGKVLRELGRLKEAEEVLLESVEGSDSANLFMVLGVALDYLGETYLSMERYSDAALQFQRSALLRQEIGEHIGVATSYRGAGLALIGLKEFAFARKMLRRCQAIYDEVGDKLRIGVCNIYLSIAEAPLSEAVSKAYRKKGISTLKESGVAAEGIRYELGETVWNAIRAEFQS